MYLPCPALTSTSERPNFVPAMCMSYTFKLHDHSHNMNQFCLGMSPSSCSDLRLHTFFSKSILCCNRANKNWKSRNGCMNGLFPGSIQFWLVDILCDTLSINLTEFCVCEYITGIRFEWLARKKKSNPMKHKEFLNSKSYVNMIFGEIKQKDEREWEKMS